MIRLDNVTVDIPVFLRDRRRGLVGNVVNRFVGGMISSGTSNRTAVRALDRVSIEINPGDRYGIIGHNGAGKTTLLKTIAGIYPCSTGTVSVDGEIRTFFNISAGLDPSRSGLVNIRNLAIYYTQDISTIDRLAPQVVAFSELGEFIEMPVSTYSAGMLARLIVSVALTFEGDILVMDEMLSAGDARFMEKVRGRLHDILSNAKILVFASNAIGMIRALCDKAIWLEKGRVRMCGDVDDVAEAFHRELRAQAETPIA
jgi:ABC-type polysaccharide/polyol phosphate transport system ATPase subunit